MAKFQRWTEEQGLTLLEGWARDGLTDEQIAHNMGVHPSTLYDWKKRFPELSEALKKGKEVVDYQVENALLKRALGYEYTEVMTEESTEGTKRRETVKQVAPDVTAQIYWLKTASRTAGGTGPRRRRRIPARAVWYCWRRWRKKNPPVSLWLTAPFNKGAIRGVQLYAQHYLAAPAETDRVYGPA